MKKSSYIIKIKHLKHIIILSLIVFTMIGLYPIIKENFLYFNTKNKTEILQKMETKSAETLSVVVASSDNISSNEIDVSVAGESYDLVAPEKNTDYIKPNIISNNFSNHTMTNIIIVHNMISKFFQNIEYSSELEKIQKLDLPKKVTLILEDMRDYNKCYLASNSNQIKTIFPDDSTIKKMIGRFIKIEKSHVNLVEQSNIRDAIIKNIHIIDEYFYGANIVDRSSSHD